MFGRFKKARSPIYTPEGAGLSCVISGSPPETPIPPDFLREAAAAVRDDVSRIGDVIERCRDGGAFAADGQRMCHLLAGVTYDCLMSEADDADPDSLLSAGQVLLDWYEAKPSDPFAAGYVAMMLGRVGYAHRGTGYAQSVTRSGWANLELYGRRSQAAISACRVNIGDHWFLRRTEARQTLAQSVDAHEARRRYQACLRDDPYDTGLHLGRMHEMLPRWHGSHAELIATAGAAADLTEDRFGQMLYAECLASIAWAEDLEPMKIDRARVLRGFQDWEDRFPSDEVLMRRASFAYEVGDMSDFVETIERCDVLFGDLWPWREPILSAYADAKRSILVGR